MHKRAVVQESSCSAARFFLSEQLPIGILTSYVLWKKGKIQVVDKEQK